MPSGFKLGCLKIEFTNINDNTKEIAHIKESLIEFEKMLDERMEPLENEREQRLTEMNKSLLDKVLGKKDD